MLRLEDATPLAVNGTDLAVHVQGDGTPLVFVHGGVSDLRTWSKQVEVFSATYRTILYSRRYSRPSAPIPPDAGDPIRVHVEDLASLIQLLEAGPAHIVGHSWGGLVSLLLAKQSPQLCLSLVLIEPPTVSMHVSVPPTGPQMLRLFLESPRLALAIAKLGGRALGPAEKAFRRGDDKAAVELFGRGVLGNERFEALSAERYQQVWENRGPDRAQALHHDFPDLSRESFSDLAVPTLLISGAESPRVFPLLNEALLEQLPNGRSCVIPGASHIVHEDAPREFNSAVLEFLEGSTAKEHG